MAAVGVVNCCSIGSGWWIRVVRIETLLFTGRAVKTHQLELEGVLDRWNFFFFYISQINRTHRVAVRVLIRCETTLFPGYCYGGYEYLTLYVERFTMSSAEVNKDRSTRNNEASMKNGELLHRLSIYWHCSEYSVVKVAEMRIM